jgi:TetR/AcrR family transcriptional repressor of nem operon
MLRERGVDAASIADVMQASGMTHGGFYKHFDSKNDLVRAAVRLAFDDIVERFDARGAENGEAEAVRAYVAEYLSKGHVAAPGVGCPVAALGADAGRHSDWLGSEFADGAERLIERISQSTSQSSRAKRDARAAAIRTLTQLVGAVVVARAFGPGPLQDEILAAHVDGMTPTADTRLTPSPTTPAVRAQPKRVK